MSTPFEHALEQLDRAAAVISLDENKKKILQAPDRVVEVSIPVLMDNGSVQIFTGYRSQHNNTLGVYKGGIRYHPGVTVEEVKALALWMTIKTAAVNIPLGGGKGGVIVNPKELSEGELERLSRGYMRQMWPVLGSDKDVPAPDVYTNAQIMNWMREEFEEIIGKKDPGVITGKPVEQGGSEGRSYATAQGGVYVTQELATKMNWKPGETTVAIQGFGNAGSHMAQILHNLGYKIVAVSDSKGGVYAEDGIDPVKALEIKEAGGMLGCYCVGTVCSLEDEVSDDGPCRKISNEALLELEVDILVPAALENVITKENAGNIKAKAIIELANGPTTPEADDILKEKEIIVVPDVLANAGGVTVSYFEWKQNVDSEHWTEDVVIERLETIMRDAFDDIWKKKEEHAIDMRTAAFAVALERIAGEMGND